MFARRQRSPVKFVPLDDGLFDRIFGRRVEPPLTDQKEGFATCADAAAANPFKEGDVVQLKSGGTRMTVCSGGCVDVEVYWFDQKDELQMECFSQAVLAYCDETIPF